MPAQQVIFRQATGATMLDVHLEMILQILADTGQILHDLDAMFSQLAGRTDAGQQQNLR